MPIPFLVPAIGALVGTAAAPALGMSAALAAGLGGGIATLAAGGDVKDALLAGATAGVGSALVPGIASGVQSMAGTAGKAVAEGATKTVAQGTTQAAGTGVAQGATNPQVASVLDKIDPEQAFKFGSKLLAQDQQQAQQGAPNMGPLPLNLGGGQQTSGDVMQSFTSGLQAGDLQMPSAQPAPQPGVQPVAPNIELQRIPLQTVTNPVRLANGGIASMAQAEMQRRGMRSLPNLGNREQAFMMARQEFARGGYIEGPGTGTSDDIPARIYQDGQPVGEALLSDGEVVLSHKDLAALDPDGNSERAGQKLGNAGNGNRGKMAAKMFMQMKGAA